MNTKAVILANSPYLPWAVLPSNSEAKKIVMADEVLKEAVRLKSDALLDERLRTLIPQYDLPIELYASLVSCLSLVEVPKAMNMAVIYEDGREKVLLENTARYSLTRKYHVSVKF